MGQSQIQDRWRRWCGGHEETDLDRAGGGCRRFGRGRIFRISKMGRTERLCARRGAGADARGRERNTLRGFRRTPASVIRRETLRLGAETASGRGLRAICQRNRFDYERDLDRMAIAVEKRGQDTTLFAILDGKFDRQKFPPMH